MTDLIAGAKPEINYGSAKEFYNPEDQRFHKNTGGTQTTYKLANDAEFCTISPSDDEDLCNHFTGYHKISNNTSVDFIVCKLCYKDSISNSTIIYQFDIKGVNRNTILFKHLKKCHGDKYTDISKNAMELL